MAEEPLMVAPFVEELASKLEGWADQIFARYGFPVYLVGSALTEQEPRDVDVIVLMPNDDWEARWGPITEYKIARWSLKNKDWFMDTHRKFCTDMGKLSARAARILGMNIDFRVQPKCDCQDGPRLRLDKCDDAFVSNSGD